MWTVAFQVRSRFDLVTFDYKLKTLPLEENIFVLTSEQYCVSLSDLI